MTFDYSVSGLTQTAFFELLNSQRRAVRELEGVRAASRERSVYTTPRSAASIELTPTESIDWLSHRVRMWGVSRFRGVSSDPIPLFTGIPVVSGEARSAYGAPVSLKLLDYSSALDVPLGANYGVAPGDIVTSKVRAMLATAGAIDAVITESSATVSAGMFWGATETKRRYVNDLLKAIGYSAVWADEWGRLHCEVYTNPGDRPVQEDLGFVHGSTCTYRPEFTIEHDTSSVPNHAVITAQTMGDLEPVVGEAWLPASHPYSFESRGGYEVPVTESNVDLAVTPLEEAPTQGQIDTYLARLQTAADAYAARLLQQRSTPSRSYVVENRWRPFDLQVATRLVAPARGPAAPIQATVTVAKDTLRYSAGGPLYMTTTLLEVV